MKFNQKLGGTKSEVMIHSKEAYSVQTDINFLEVLQSISLGNFGGIFSQGLLLYLFLTPPPTIYFVIDSMDLGKIVLLME